MTNFIEMKRFINFLILLWYWDTVSKAQKIIKDPKSNASHAIREDLTMEEISGVEDLEGIARIFDLPTSTLTKELKHLKGRLLDR